MTAAQDNRAFAWASGIACAECGHRPGEVPMCDCCETAAAADRAERERVEAAGLAALAQVALAREAYEAFVEAWTIASGLVREVDHGAWYRVDAYPGWTGGRDVGAGLDMVGWIDEVEGVLQDHVDSARDG